MADETILIDIEFESNAAEEEKEVDSLTESIEGLKVAQSKLKEQTEKGTVSQKDASKQNEKLKTQIQSESKQRKDLLKIMQTEKGSRDRLRLTISKMIKERNSLNTSTAKGAKRSEELRKSIDKLNNELKESGTQTEKNKMSIGGYEDAINNVAPGLGGFIKGMKGMTKASLTFLATPIGAVIGAIGLALGALIGYFKNSEKGQNALNKITTIAGAIWDNLKDAVAKVGEIIFNAVTKPKEAVKALGEFIKQNLINRFKAFGKIGNAVVKIFSEDWKAGLKDLGNAAGQLATGMEDPLDKIAGGFKKIREEISADVIEAGKMADAQAVLDVAERKSLVSVAKLRSEIANLRADAAKKDSISAVNRLKLLDEAIKKQNEILNIDEAIATEKLRLKQIENSLANSTKEALQEEAELEAALFNMQTSNAERRRRFLNEQLTSRKEVAAEEKAIAEAEAAEVQAARDREQEIISFDRELELEQEAEQNELKLEIQAEQDAAVLEMNADLEKEKTKLTEEGEANRRAAIGASLSAIGQLSGQANALLQQQNQNRLSNDLAALNAKEQSALAMAGTNEAKRAQIEATFQKKREKLEKDAAKKAKKLAITMAIIRGALVILNALNTAPFVPVGVIAAAAAAVVTGFQIAAIKNAKMEKGGQVPLAKKGANFGTFNGPSHASGGIDLFTGSGKHVANVEGNENFYVINKKASDHLNGLSDINQRIGGGVPLNGTATKMARGGQANVETAQPGIDISDITRQVVDRLPPIVVMTEDIKTGLEDRNEVVNVGVI